MGLAFPTRKSQNKGHIGEIMPYSETPPHICHDKSINTTLYALFSLFSLIAKFMGPTWGPYGADRSQVGPKLAP